MESDYFPVAIYFVVVAAITAATLGATALFSGRSTSLVKYMPYESGIQTTTDLLQERFPLRHYLTALMFLLFDIEVIFLYPWAVVAKSLGSFAFLEISWFLIVLLIGFAYVFRKGGMEWQ